MDQSAIQTTLQVNGIRMGAVICGQRTPPIAGTLVLVHGFTGCASGWGELLLQLVVPGWRVVALDMLGHGFSEAPPDAARYSIERCQEDIVACLRELGVPTGEAVLLGYSMGGRIALYAAFSRYFRALILESASPGLVSPGERELRHNNDNLLAASIERDGMAAFVQYWEQLPLFHSQHNLPANVREALHAQRLRNNPKGLANSLRGVGTGVQPPLHQQLAQLDLPVLLMAGDLDQKYCDIARQMAQALPQAVLHIVHGAGHTVHLEQPAIFATLVREFCTTSI